MEIRVLGPLEVVASDGTPIVIGSPKQRELLGLLAARVPEVVSTDRIIDALWRNAGDHVGSLRVHVTRLRDVLDPDRCEQPIVTRPPGYGLGIPPDSIDAHRFAVLIAEAEKLATDDLATTVPLLDEALGLWRGPPYAEFEYAEWARSEVRHLEELRLVALELRIDARLAAGANGGLVPELESLVDEHPLRERFWGQLMTALYRSGRQPDALRAYRRSCDVFGELGTAPSAELNHLEEQILLRDPAIEADLALSLGSGPSATRGGLPPQRTSFVGRARELALGAGLLAQSRLLTLTGPPGSGKTRLALRLAALHQSEFADGCFFVPLAAVNDARLVGATIGQVLGVREVEGKTALEGLQTNLRERRVLLLLDNFEQVAEAALMVGELLDAAPRITILVTSRSPLGISGEQEFPVPPLSIPPVDQHPDLEAVSSYDAVALFAARARASNPAFDLNAENVETVAAIIGRLDGLPLAIELAAARVKVLTLEDLLGRLSEGLAVLADGPTDVVARHQTLRNAIAWSYDLLEPAEQVLFRRLGVLRGFTLDAAAVVAGFEDADTFHGVVSLLSKSLVYRTLDVGEARFAMLETLREFALEQLDAAGEKPDASRRHADYFLHLAERSEPELSRDHQRTHTDQLLRELDNIRGALRHALITDDPDLGLRLASSIWRFWESSGQMVEGRRWLEGFLANLEARDSVRAKGLSGLASLAYWQGDYDEAWTRYEEALDLYRAIGDRFNEADTLFGMSITATLQEDPDSGERLAKAARVIFEDLGAREEIGKIFTAQAAALLQKREYPAARPLWQAALAISRELGDQHLAVTQLIGLAICAFHNGDPGEARSIALAAVEEAAQLQNVTLEVWMLDFFAAFAASIAPEAAARLAGAVDSLRTEEGGGMRLGPLFIEDARSVAARVLNPEQLSQAWGEGRAMSLEQAVGYAMEVMTSQVD